MTAHFTYRRRIRGLLLVAAALGWSIAGTYTWAQRPIQTFDPFYQGESAVRSFFDAYALTAELTYRPPGLLQSDQTSVSNIGANSLGVNLRLDYQLSRRLDLGFFVDATGNASGRSLDLSWVSLKYFKRLEGMDYAIRFAIDPSSDGRSGFPQADLGFLYTALLSPTVSQDFGIGIRRVQIGFQELIQIDPSLVDPGDPIVPAQDASTEIVRGRTQGWEVHMSWSHNILFDPAGSNLFIAFIGEGGKYDLVEWTVGQGTDQNERSVTDYTGGVLWIRSGLEIERPGYRFAPFISVPFKQWATPTGDWPRSRARVGLRLMLR